MTEKELIEMYLNFEIDDEEFLEMMEEVVDETKEC
jgi:hypothetical protein